MQALPEGDGGEQQQQQFAGDIPQLQGNLLRPRPRLQLVQGR